LRGDEQLVWAGQPQLKPYLRDLSLTYPICLISSGLLLVMGWVFFSWAQGAGALADLKILAVLAIIGIGAVGGVFVPLLWPLKLHRSWYALTTRRILIREPRLLILWPRVFSIDAARLTGLRIQVYLPDRSGRITWGPPAPLTEEGRLRRFPAPGLVLNYVPEVERVAELIRRTLLPSSLEQP
jgi:hypothetical protein